MSRVFVAPIIGQSAASGAQVIDGSLKFDSSNSKPHLNKNPLSLQMGQSQDVDIGAVGSKRLGRSLRGKYVTAKPLKVLYDADGPNATIVPDLKILIGSLLAMVT